MTQRLRKPLYQAPQPHSAALHYVDSPAAALEAIYRRVWETSMHDMPFVNSALSVAAVGFQRYQGDWVGAVITPWFLNLFVMPGGGTLWTDHASGERVKIAFPVGELEFISDYDPGGALPACQYCPLFAPVSQFANQDSALAAAEAALGSLFVAVGQPAAESIAEARPIPAVTPSQADEAVPARRAFFRTLAGHHR